MNKHTPGDWKAVVTRYRNGVTGDQGVHCHIVVEPNARPLPMHAGNNKVDPEEVIANGKLLAAAPKLLAACKAARGYGSPGDTEDGVSVSYLLDMAIKMAEEGEIK